METNNFKRLMEEDEAHYNAPHFGFHQVQNNVQHSLGFFRFIGQIVEVYLPRMFDYVVKSTGGDQQSPRKAPDRNGKGNFKPPTPGK